MNHAIQEHRAGHRTSAHDIDLHIGRRVRALRKALGLNQVELGAQIGVSFQQVQKYETAKSRISAAMLVTMAQALRTAPGAFYEDLNLDAARPARRGSEGLSCAA